MSDTVDWPRMMKNLEDILKSLDVAEKDACVELRLKRCEKALMDISTVIYYSGYYN